jgi:6-phosphogluconolactonase
MVKYIINKDRSKLEKKAAERIGYHINDLLKEQKHVVLGIVGGSSVPRIYARLKDVREVDWSKVHVFMADERRVPHDDEDSNYGEAKRHGLGDLIEKHKLQAHPFEYDSNLDDYIEKFNSFGGKFDILLLSSGKDGHIASMFPGDSSVGEDSVPYMDVKAPEGNPVTHRITITGPTVEKAKVALLLFFGKHKEEAYRTFREDGSYIECPARLVKRVKKAYVLTDISG